MRRGRTILIILVVIVILVIVGVVLFRMFTGTGTKSDATPTPGVRYVEIITAGQNIPPGSEITEEMLSTMSIPENLQVTGEYTDKNEIIGQFARMQIAQSLPIMESMLSTTPGVSTSPGSIWASQIPQGLTAISIPISRLDLVGYAVQDNDFVNVIVTMLVVDVDSNYQSELPNRIETIFSSGALEGSTPQLTVLSTDFNTPLAYQGRTELDATLNNAIYVVPAEAQRPRMVTQMVMQNVQVLHVGSFPLPGEETEEVAPSDTGTTPTPAAEVQASQIVRPDIITLLVTPQDAVVLVYFVHDGAHITLNLRNPNDYDFRTTTDAATLQYIWSQYNIPVPAKLPYATEPRIDALVDPVLPNDVIISSPDE